jgi:uncharacterized protein YabN with tetrapyrrole methylase and pyrophosphatase domain
MPPPVNAAFRSVAVVLALLGRQGSRALAVSEQAGRARFDWPDVAGVLAKLEEELAELRAALQQGRGVQAGEEIGDLLFTLVNAARLAGHHPETLLSGAVRKFERRFRGMEAVIAARGQELSQVPQSEKDSIWESIKTAEADRT